MNKTMFIKNKSGLPSNIAIVLLNIVRVLSNIEEK